MRREYLNSLAMLLIVAEERSFTRAAAKVGISQSALSHAVSRLEAKLGLRLLARTTRSVAPTEAGERLIETLAPALEEIDARIDALTALKERPGGTLRITTSELPARTILWPVIDRLTAEYTDIRVELNIETGFTDIVAGRFDAGVRLGERLEQDMVAMRIGPRLRMASVGSPAYFAQAGKPRTPHELAGHSCINLRMASGGTYAWEFEKDGRKLNIKAEGQLVFNDIEIIKAAAIAGHGIAHVIDDRVAASLDRGELVRVLEDWCEPFDGYHLYYPRRRQPSSAFKLLLEALRYRE